MTDDIQSEEPIHGGEEDKELKDAEGKEPADGAETQARLKAFADLLVLRFFSATPGLVSYMINSGVVNNAVEFSFWHLPDEIISGVKKVSACHKVEVFKFYTKGEPCTGFRFFPDKDDLADFEIPTSEEGDKHAGKRFTSHPPAGGAAAVTTPESV